MPSIRSFGRYLPEQVLTNNELAGRLGCKPEWIYEVSGIEERRVAKEQSVASLAVQAAQDCLDRGRVSASDVKLVIVSSGSAEQRFPGPAALVAKELGLAGIPALDLPVASAGSLFALATASQLAPVYGTVLVVAAEKMSEPAQREPLNKNVAILFGDGAGACLVDPADTGLQIRNHALHSDGNFAEDLKLDLEGTVKMNGLTVIMQASRKLPSAIAEVLGAGEVKPKEVSVFLMHQANQNLIDRVARAIGVPSSRFFTNIHRYGNTSSASMLIAASEWHEHHPPASGDLICFAAFGAGFHWGALLATQA
ncbi:MAG: ketoacyl-ACP synthase III [Bryobacteraceae bacterium]